MEFPSQWEGSGEGLRRTISKEDYARPSRPRVVLSTIGTAKPSPSPSQWEGTGGKNYRTL
jgi:hypothetical protein